MEEKPADLVAWFRAELDADLEKARRKLNEARGMKPEGDEKGEIYVSFKVRKAVEITKWGNEVYRLAEWKTKCFPDPEYVQGGAETLWNRKHKPLY